jgi:hypothetical protein
LAIYTLERDKIYKGKKRQDSDNEFNGDLHRCLLLTAAARSECTTWPTCCDQCIRYLVHSRDAHVRRTAQSTRDDPNTGIDHTFI